MICIKKNKLGLAGYEQPEFSYGLLFKKNLLLPFTLNLV